MDLQAEIAAFLLRPGYVSNALGLPFTAVVHRVHISCLSAAYRQNNNRSKRKQEEAGVC